MVNDFQPQPPRIHGGPDHHGVPLHDFSTNSNACGPCPIARVAVAQADASHYPDASYTILRGKLAAFHAVEPWRIVVAASASEFIFRITALAKLQGGASVHVPAHSFGDYAHAAKAWGLTLATQPAEAAKSALVWHCQPSSPLGQIDIAPIAMECAGDTLHVLDLAYAPLRLGQVKPWEAARYDSFWQLYSPNKALGLTGVRAAYAIAPPGTQQWVSQLASLCASWPLGAHGVALLNCWTSAEVQAWLKHSLQTLQLWKVRQIALLESLGWTCLPSDTNFFCARPARPADLDLLRAAGIKLRDTASFGLPGHVRVSVQPPHAQAALAVAWRGLCAAY